MGSWAHPSNDEVERRGVAPTKTASIREIDAGMRGTNRLQHVNDQNTEHLANRPAIPIIFLIAATSFNARDRVCEKSASFDQKSVNIDRQCGIGQHVRITPPSISALLKTGI
jgi:hypothetical protein